MVLSHQKKRQCPKRWSVLLIILAALHGTNGQDEDPTTSPAPSTTQSAMPSMVPIIQTQQPTESPVPSSAPSSDPTTTWQPSFKPTISFQPTVSEAPSSRPTRTAMPTLTKRPSDIPSVSLIPSMTPTAQPSVAPSAKPEMITAEKFNNRMIFDGLPFILNMSLVPNTNRTGNLTWANLTSEYVVTYWRDRNYSDFNITSVVTNVINQFPEPTDTITTVPRTRVIYDQQIRYTSTGINSPLHNTGDNDSVLFIWPFRANSQPYVDELYAAFSPPNRIHMLEVSLARIQPTAAPTMAPNGPVPSISPDDGKIDTPVIVAIVLGSVAAVGLVLFIIIWYITRRKPDIMLDEEFEHVDDVMLVAPPSEDPRVIVPGASYPHHQQQQQQQHSEREQSWTETQSEDNIYIEDDEKDSDYDRDESLHVGVPVEGDVEGDSMEDDDDSYYYLQQDAHRESVMEANRPSLTAFGLQISELED